MQKKHIKIISNVLSKYVIFNNILDERKAVIEIENKIKSKIDNILAIELILFIRQHAFSSKNNNIEKIKKIISNKLFKT